MQITNSLHSFHTLREIGIKVLAPADQLIREHILAEKCLKHDFQIPETAINFELRGRVIIYSTPAETAVYDIVARKIIFSALVIVPEDQEIGRYIFSEHGLMLIVVGDKNVSSIWGKHVRSIRFVQNGVETGQIEIDGQQLRFEEAIILHDKVVMRWSESSKITYDVCDYSGRLKKRITTEAFNQDNRYIATNNDQFDILISCTDVGRKQTSANLFVLDLIIGQKRKFKLESHEDSIEISAAAIIKNTLVYGMTYLRCREGALIKSNFEPKVVEVNILTGQIEKTYHLKNVENNRVKKILITDDYIIVLIKNYLRTEAHIEIIERQTKNINIINITGYTYIKLSSVSQCLMIYRRSYCHLYDLSTQTMIKTENFVSGGLFISFSEGRRMFLDRDQVVHIEDYTYEG